MDRDSPFIFGLKFSSQRGHNFLKGRMLMVIPAIETLSALRSARMSKKVLLKMGSRLKSNLKTELSSEFLYEMKIMKAQKLGTLSLEFLAIHL